MTSEAGLNRSNKIHQIIKAFQEMFPREFEMTKIKKCYYCNGVGFRDIQLHFQREHNVCKTCKGVGYHGYNTYKHKDAYVCKYCNAVGCDICNYTGVSDWVAAAMTPPQEGEKEKINNYESET